jgi:2-oxoglutarate ferredoxin oxidoreductase subunit beta
MQLIRHIQETTVPMARAAKMSSQELEGKFVVGELYRNTDRPEFCDECEKLRQRVQAIVSKQKAAAPAA